MELSSVLEGVIGLVVAGGVSYALNKVDGNFVQFTKDLEDELNEGPKPFDDYNIYKDK